MRAIGVFGVSVLFLSAVSCDSGAVVCGDDTIEINGVCMSKIRSGPPNTCCGPNTTWDATLLVCVGEATVVCDPETTTEVTDEDGIKHCVGEASCGPIRCPNAQPGKLNVCGQLVDTETSARLDLGEGGLCDLSSPADSGPCSLALEFYDALQFAQNPTGTAALPFDNMRINECGFFAVEGIPAPALGFLGIGVDDADDLDDHVLTGVAVPANGGDRIEDLTVYVTLESTVQMWTDSADMPFGTQTFAEHGVYMPVFLHCGTPVSGVTVTTAGSPQPAFDYYFSDTDPALRTTVDVGLNATGVNGTALLAESELVMNSGASGEIDGCEWPSPLGAAIPGVVFAQQLHSVDPSSGDRCTCP